VIQINTTRAKPTINPDELLKRQTHIKQLIPQLKIEVNKSHPIYWQIKAIEGNKYELEQYKTHTGRNSLEKMYSRHFFEDSTNVKVIPMSR
jgi:hypothetical protein